MAAGDAYIKAPTSTASGSFLDLQPGSGVEVVIHDIYVAVGSAYEVYYSDATNNILYLSMPAGGGALNLQAHCTDTYYVRVKNTSGSTIYMAASGMTTK
jgi:hypothetical protein